MANTVYLAAPFFSDLQIERVRKVEELLKKNSTIDSEGIFVPMDHQYEEEEFGSFKWQVGVFETDVRQVRKADIVVAILDYTTQDKEVISDPGTVFEIGTAFEHGTPVVLVQFDDTNKINLMLARSHTAFFNGKKIDELATYNFDILPPMYSDLTVF
ncbi:nucleoside 2-deoxyribosyltransferase [Pediococcus stilesii]|uniref:Purine deoxyribosyltransferase n=1 Tax=Pediococcus stilesii TaxID=331679 RepID=A0A0R2L3V2_9LACO|nr:nucleoside 2-deoxyribosyltransferase [Pediococcus stilesii]KRN93431.1 purine deoxyribosyltransferase [Pediococcus stilesii]